MKWSIFSLIFFTLLGITQLTWCDSLGFDTAFNNMQARLERMMDKKINNADNKLQVSLENAFNKGFTNGSIKIGGLGIALASLILMCTDISKKPATDQQQPNCPDTWNVTKLATGTTGIIIGIALIACADRMTNYLYKKSA